MNNTTTSKFQTRPDFYTSADECKKFKEHKKQTNIRYRDFNQDHFTAGDEEQFDQYRDAISYNICMENINLDKNLFSDIEIQTWEKYSNLYATCVINTFRYIFNKFKKGIFVKIANNKVRVFLPFSKVKFINEWSTKIKVDPKYINFTNFAEYISRKEGRTDFNRKKVNEFPEEWYGNNCLVRFENPISEGDSSHGSVKNMLEELCENREIPDIEFFVNRRDYPLLKNDGTEAYNNIWGSENYPLVSHKYEQYSPILSMCVSDKYADVAIPTWEDWSRVQSYEKKYFPKICDDYNYDFSFPWDRRKPIAVFRGASTGCGVDINTNPRLKLAYLSKTTKSDEKGIPFLDAGITKWNLRPRKIQGSEYLKTIDIDSLPFGLVNKLSRQEQTKYKYIINVDGHVSAFRLSLELSMGSVILLADSPWKIWYRKMLEPYVHYVPIKSDLSDLISQIIWCRKNDDKCQEIVKNAKKFYQKYLQKNGIFDYMQKILVSLKKKMGVYLYNVQTPLQIQINKEIENLPAIIDKDIKNINALLPLSVRNYSTLQGIEWTVQIILKNYGALTSDNNLIPIFQNKLGVVRKFVAPLGFSFAVKTTSDKRKSQEHIHESFIGTRCINNLIKHIPNFVYIFGMYKNDDTVNVVEEYIPGITLFEYINNNDFTFGKFLFIVLQIALSIHMAQNICGFVHYDLTPWNIILQTYSEKINIDYLISYNNVIRVNTMISPTIIDYGKSHVIYDGKHYGLVNMYKANPSQDVITLLVTSIDQILNVRTKNGDYRQLSHNEFYDLLHLSNFLSGTAYRRERFTNSRDLRGFLRKAKRYASLLEINQDLQTLTPYKLAEYIMNMKTYGFPVTKSDRFTNIMNKGNSRQVFDFIFSKSIKEKLDSYINVCINLKQCTLPQPKNKLFLYYILQTMVENLSSVRNEMVFFAQQNRLVVNEQKKIFDETIEFVIDLYKTKIDGVKSENISYKMDNDFNKLILAPYDESTFLLPNVILELLEKKENLIDLSDYKNILEFILTNNGPYKLPEEEKKYYIKNFEKLLSVNSFNMKNNCANWFTLENTSKEIYEIDKKGLIEKGQECEEVKEYLKLYNKLI